MSFDVSLGVRVSISLLPDLTDYLLFFGESKFFIFSLCLTFIPANFAWNIQFRFSLKQVEDGGFDQNQFLMKAQDV